ncbi:MAG: bifunctional proline dehydrogenase/L-glutamate gamma-semialdehyde dehydrogenase [Gammaproteobacteria bacterium TMED95]|nr:MAG: bifunctional proline dehydrogenase/L-glutamate gamma-semialdehyde dehydrogenase [Gammaproteobacteria bacterium TMED95]RZO42512.1 MAG: bifunctional proline dehydrogenase/L-glutamate gamma-semialdehyde dehydrogenase PutA [Paracoccaceae bacterium]
MNALDKIRKKIRQYHLIDERSLVPELINLINLNNNEKKEIMICASELVDALRLDKNPGIMEVFLAEYGLSNDEGISLMCLAEALLRVPDTTTIDSLIKDKLTNRGWVEHIGNSESTLVNASTWALLLTGKVLKNTKEPNVYNNIHLLIKKFGEPFIRKAVRAAMKEMGNQFVLGQSIEKAVKRGTSSQKKGYTFSYDMLGEAALTNKDATIYTNAYAETISYLSKYCTSDDIRDNPGISIKLSALYPRYELVHKKAVLDILGNRLLDLALKAKKANMGLNIDAEEAARLDLSLDIIEKVFSNPLLSGWNGFGVVVQSYSKRTLFVIDWLYALSSKYDQKIMVRLVKGAYWDTEIKISQSEGMLDFPVFTSKAATDISYLACASKLFEMTDYIFPQFATHNAHTIYSILKIAKKNKNYEFQRLHGMGESLFSQLMQNHKIKCRIYAPVGVHDDLLAYLVRRLLENGANSSFVNQILDKKIRSSDVVLDPIYKWKSSFYELNKVIKPKKIYDPSRINSSGYDLNNVTELDQINIKREKFKEIKWILSSQLKSEPSGSIVSIANPFNSNDIVGEVKTATVSDVNKSIENATLWTIPNEEKTIILNKIADLYEKNFIEIFAILTREAGKTISDAISEIREAVDFIRYYSFESSKLTDSKPLGKIVCISPWNFPLAIFTGQIIAALSVGNAVLAKPADYTPIIAIRAVELMYKAGVPRTSLQLLIGDGPILGDALVTNKFIDGICFTGSTNIAKLINKNSASEGNPYVSLVAETGGINAMIVDSTALPEQAVKDILASSFQSAGQRCSALRMLYLQEDIAHKFLEMLYGAMDELIVNDPWLANTDIGPIISINATKDIEKYINLANDENRVLHQVKIPAQGSFVKPTVIKVESIKQLEREIFGPVLHVATFKSADIPGIVDDINNKGYGLTFGVHSRIDSRIHYICENLNVGNIYVNRNQIGAVVGTQPFGGEGLSGTGPKAGGPSYLYQFVKGNVNTTYEYADKKTEIENAQKIIDECYQVERKVLNCTSLPGPTGESNILTTYPKGIILCLGPTEKQAELQAKSVRDIGSTACIVLGLDLNNLSKLENFSAVMLFAKIDMVRVAKKALAEKNGSIIPLITNTETLKNMKIERHVCINTTAAGGNVELLINSN